MQEMKLCFRPHQGIILFNVIANLKLVKLHDWLVSVPIRGLFYLTNWLLVR